MNKFSKLMITLFLGVIFIMGWWGVSWAPPRLPYDTLKQIVLHPKTAQTSAPTVNDYQWLLYTIWIDESTDKAYILVDTTTGAAVWNYIGGTTDDMWSGSTIYASSSHGIWIVEDSGVSGIHVDDNGDVTTDGSITTARTANPSATFKSSSCTDEDINAILYVSPTDTGSGSEDIDVFLQAQLAGTLVDLFDYDASADELTLNRDVRIGKASTTAENSGVTLTTARFGEVIDINSASQQEVYLPIVDSTDAGGGYHFNVIEGGVTLYSDTTNNTDYVHDSDIGGYIFTTGKGTLSVRLDVSGATWMITRYVGTWTTAP